MIVIMPPAMFAGNGLTMGYNCHKRQCRSFGAGSIK